MKERIELLSNEILKHKRLYYEGRHEIEDDEYDRLEDELRKLDPENPVLKMVGSDFFSKEKVKHTKKMLSLDKKYKIEELSSWLEDHEVIGMFKVDGSSSSLIYKDGNLTLAKTRGNGEYGENISSPVFFIPSVVNETDLKEDFEVRGEIYCTREKFERLSKEMVSRGIDKPKSIRNVVAGILGRKDHVDLAKFLDFKAFDILRESDPEKEIEKINLLEGLGFETPNVSTMKDKIELGSFLANVKDFMENGDYLIDGAVLVYNDVKTQKEKGYTSHHPKYKMAFKFQSEGSVTVLNDIDWQISRFGVYTPVGLVEPVEVDGATISKVTLHNLKTVKLFNLKKGDTIKIVRSGEVIPKFLEVIEPSDNELKYPSNCKFCNSKLIEDDVRLTCENEDCEGRHSGYILNFVKKIGIDDLSDKRLDPMIELGMINTIPDLYRLTKEDLLSLPQTQEKLANKILKNINESKNVNIIKFLSSLNFKGGAKKNTELILDSGVNSFESLFKITEEELLEIKGFAKKKAEDYIASLHKNRELINELLELGFNVEWPSNEKSSSTLEGLIFCITGDLEIAENRKALENLIKDNGGKTSSSVSKNTNYLICNNESSSSKYKKSQSLDVPIITEKDFEKMFLKIN